MTKIPDDARGMALIMVMWMLVILLVLASQFVVSARSDLDTVINFKEDREAYFLAYGGVQAAIKEIMQDADYHYYVNGQLKFAKAADEENETDFSRREFPLGEGGRVSYRIEDGSTRINLNGLARDRGALMRLMEKLFPDGVEAKDRLADSIMDWVDEDNDTRPNGAEKEYYLGLNPPYHAKNGEFDAVPELKKVRDVTEEIYKVLAPVLTVYPAGNLNLNTASPEAMLAGGVSPEKVSEVMEARKEKGYYDKASRANIFVVTGTGSFEGSRLKHSIRAVIQKTGPRKIRVVDWTDDFYGPDYSPSVGEEKPGIGNEKDKG